MSTLYVVAYDIPDNRRRGRLFRIMRGFGRHTQFSVFECHLDHGRLAQMLGKIRLIIDPAEDDVKVYPLCLRCAGEVFTLGIARPPANPRTIVV